MKKFLACLATLSLILPTAASVVSCGPKISDNVLLVLPGLSMSSASKITRSYQQIVEDFNNTEEMKNSAVKVEAAWENGDAIQQRASGMEQLPDLYVAYPDLASKYILDSSKSDFARDMGKTFIGNESHDQNTKTSKQNFDYSLDNLMNNFWAKSFYEEGLISKDPKKKPAHGQGDNSDLFVLPLIKSFDMSVVNLKVFLELISFVKTPEQVEKLSCSLSKDKEQEVKPSKLFVNSSQSLKFLSNENLTDKNRQAMLEELDQIIASENPHEAIREFFQKGENILQLGILYAELYNNYLSPNISDYTGISGKTQKMYSVGIDSTANQIFMNYADINLDNKEKEATQKISGDEVPAINPYHEEDFFYHIKDMNPNSERMDVVLDSPKDETFTKIAHYFNGFRDLAWANGNHNDGDPNIRWAGSLMIGRLDNKTYTTNYFNQGTMLVSSSSTAGSWSIAPTKNQFDKENDLLVVAGPTMNGEYQNFIQQGPGLAGFKSIGKTAKQKEEVTTKFVRYLLQPKVQNKLAIMSGYIPSTKEALEMYKYYKDGTFDNATGTWNQNANLPEDFDKSKFEQIAEPRKNTYLDQRDGVLSQLLKEYADQDDENGIKMNVVTTRANPAGALLRDAIESALRNYVFKQLLPFETLLEDSKKKKASIVSQFYDLLPGSFSSSRIWVK